MTLTLIGTHDEDLVAVRRRAMVSVFANALTPPYADTYKDARLVKEHARNVDLFGFYDAEIIRADAFAEAVAAAPPPVPIPVGEAEDSDLGAFDAAGGA